MLNVRIQIGDGAVRDSKYWGLVYLDSDKRVGAPTKGFESTSYPEEEGENIIPKTVDDAFDYKVKFFIQADSTATANTKITAFNNALFEATDDVKTYYQVTFYNDHRRIKIVGYPKPIAEATELWHDPKNYVNDVYVVEWEIRVTKPSLCSFSDSSSS